MDMRIPPLRVKIPLESSPLKSRILVRRLALHCTRGPEPCASRAKSLQVVLLLGVSLAALLLLWLQAWLAETHPGPAGADEAVPAPSRGARTVVCLCAGDPDFRPLKALMSSALASAAKPERLAFHVVTSRDLVAALGADLAAAFPGQQIVLHHNAALQQRLAALAQALLRTSTDAPAGFTSLCGLAAFFLDEFLGRRAQAEGRRLYLDAETVVLGDLAELGQADLRGQACGAVRDCRRRLGDFVNLEEAARLGLEADDPEACVADGGALVIDVARWRQRNLTGKVQDWLERCRGIQADLWHGSPSQAPWSLAVGQDLADLSPEWGCGGAGQRSLPPADGADWEANGPDGLGLDAAAMEELGAVLDEGGLRPPVLGCAAGAKLLRFDGPLGPWRAERGAGAVCTVPAALAGQAGRGWARTVRGQRFVRCAELWALFAVGGPFGPKATRGPKPVRLQLPPPPKPGAQRIRGARGMGEPKPRPPAQPIHGLPPARGRPGWPQHPAGSGRAPLPPGPLQHRGGHDGAAGGAGLPPPAGPHRQAAPPPRPPDTAAAWAEEAAPAPRTPPPLQPEPADAAADAQADAPADAQADAQADGAVLDTQGLQVTQVSWGEDTGTEVSWGDDVEDAANVGASQPPQGPSTPPQTSKATDTAKSQAETRHLWRSIN